MTTHDPLAPPPDADLEQILSHMEPDLWPLARKSAAFLLDSRQSNKHDRRSLDEIRASLVRHGQKKPIYVLRSTMEVKAGNGTLLAARELLAGYKDAQGNAVAPDPRWAFIAAVVSDDPEELAREYAIRDNRTHQFSDFDTDILQAEIADLNLEPTNVGWDAEEWGVVVGEQVEQPKTEDVLEQSDKLKAFIEKRKAFEKTAHDRVEKHFWLCLVFQSFEQRQEFLAVFPSLTTKYGMYCDGEHFSEIIGHPVTPTVLPDLKAPVDKALVPLALPVPEASKATGDQAANAAAGAVEGDSGAKAT